MAAHDVANRIEFRVVAGEGVEDQVPTGDVALRGVEEQAVVDPLGTEVVDLLQERKLHVAGVFDADLLGEGGDCPVLPLRPTEVVERQRPEVPAAGLRPPQGHGGVDAAGKEDDRALHASCRLRRVSPESGGPAEGRPRSHKYLSQGRPGLGPVVATRPAAGARGTAATGRRARPRSPRSFRPTNVRAARRTGPGAPR